MVLEPITPMLLWPELDPDVLLDEDPELEPEPEIDPVLDENPEPDSKEGTDV